MRLKFIVCWDRKSVCHQVTNGIDSLSFVRCQLLAPGTLPLSSDPLLYWVLMSFILFFSAKYLWKGTLSEFTLSEILSIAGLYVKAFWIDQQSPVGEEYGFSNPCFWHQTMVVATMISWPLKNPLWLGVTLAGYKMRSRRQQRTWHAKANRSIAMGWVRTINVSSAQCSFMVWSTVASLYMHWFSTWAFLMK